MHIEFAFYCSGCVTHQQMCNSEMPGTSFTMLKSSNLVQGFFFFKLNLQTVFFIYGDREDQDQGISRCAVWRRPTSWFVDSHPLAQGSQSNLF